MTYEEFKTLVLPVFVRLVLKLAAGAITYLGFETGDAIFIITGLVGAVGGVVWSLFQRKKDIATIPPEVKP